MSISSLPTKPFVCLKNVRKQKFYTKIRRKIAFLGLKYIVRDLNGAVLRLIGLVLRRGPDRLVPEVISGI